MSSAVRAKKFGLYPNIGNVLSDYAFPPLQIFVIKRKFLVNKILQGSICVSSVCGVRDLELKAAVTQRQEM